MSLSNLSSLSSSMLSRHSGLYSPMGLLSPSRQRL